MSNLTLLWALVVALVIGVGINSIRIEMLEEQLSKTRSK